MRVTDHYNERYFAWQSSGGNDQGIAESFKFLEFITEEDYVLDFGCGSGALLRTIGPRSGKVVGVEVNPAAIEYARASGLVVHADLTMIDSDSINVVISNHVLEHVENPVQTLRELRRVLKSDGKLIVVVPCDQPSYPFMMDDVDFHLFSWSANNLGNIARASGFEVLQVSEIKHKWPPGWKMIKERLGWGAFHLSCKLWAHLDRRRSQIRLVARKSI